MSCSHLDHPHTHGPIIPFKGITPTLAKGVYVDPTARLSGDIHLDEDSSVWPFVAARGDVNSMRVGKRSNIQDGTVLHVTHKSERNPAGWPLVIGDDVTVGHNATLHGCTIGDRVLVGMGAIVLDGAIVESDVVIGAGSLVPPGKRLESGFMYMGSPCKQVRPLSEAEMAYFTYSANNYVELKQHYMVGDHA